MPLFLCSAISQADQTRDPVALCIVGKHVCALSAYSSTCLNILPLVNSTGLLSTLTGKCRQIHGRTSPLGMVYQEKRLLKWWPRISRDFLTLKRNSSCTVQCTWGETLLSLGWYLTVCTADFWMSDRQASLPACRWPCFPSSQHLPSTMRPCPAASCPLISTVHLVLWCGGLWLVWSAVGSIPSSWLCLWMSASPPGTTPHLCRRRAAISGSGWTLPSRSWGKWGRCWQFKPFLESTWVPGTSKPTRSWSRWLLLLIGKNSRTKMCTVY